MLFDLDETLYPGQTGLLAHIDQRIDDYLRARLGVEEDALSRLRMDYWRKYGTTLRGVKENHGIDPLEYIAFAYDVDPRRFLQPDLRLREMLERLPWRKAIFSNSPAEYAVRVLQALDIAGSFHRIFGIDFAGHLGKPDPETYRLVLAELDLPGEACVMIDDCDINLLPAHELGMTTVLLGSGRREWVDFCIQGIMDLESVLRP